MAWAYYDIFVLYIFRDIYRINRYIVPKLYYTICYIVSMALKQTFQAFLEHMQSVITVVRPLDLLRHYPIGFQRNVGVYAVILR
jgi:hypothetical protein